MGRDSNPSRRHDLAPLIVLADIASRVREIWVGDITGAWKVPVLPASRGMIDRSTQCDSALVVSRWRRSTVVRTARVQVPMPARIFSYFSPNQPRYKS